ncbi:LLM class F420-dependent oxidoreductase [Streptomyces tsukubensis]|uniref:LLM class F420-dependent oxidoreductase n=1 Tax=Streptomyces tsukubensis TaxID=83656 RepID=A0A1V4AF80_9ACTN|nr:LLM class F420-dependent oxidoreductase [Streptomyces tsukubensis]OON82049.1 LLM class F420-dependent oxidoreductase [Streptomyces tsukubensis]QFR92535.1 TIGR03619 family F420-dependent LLM class oxidoreductase [Streptomyces tsukubensis]
MTIRLGLGLPQTRHYDIGRDVPAVARAAERTGYESLWVLERILFPEPATQGLYGIPGLAWPDYYRGVADPLVTLTLAGAVTERARLGTSVLVAPLHIPFQLARSLASLDAATGGRVVAGIGTGWSHDEYAAAGVAPFEKRGAVLDELLDVCAAVWGPDLVSYKGQLTTIAPSVVGPKPAGHIPVLLPANSPRALRRLVDRADGWMPVGMGADDLAQQYTRLRELAAERGRKAPIEVVVRANARYSAAPYEGDDRAPFQGSVEQIVEDVAAHAETGIGEILIDIQTGTRDATELIDVADAIYAGVRGAGV